MAQNGKMVILRGNDYLDGKSYPDESGKMVTWPLGALHVQAATDYAKQRGYEGIVLDLPGRPQSDHSPQSKKTLELIRGDTQVRALYGFSGGGYNVRHILKYLKHHEPTLLDQIALVVVLGSPNKYGNDKIYKASYYDCKPGWELVFRCNPPRSLLPKGLPKNTPAHMFGPDVLLAGWPETAANCG
jgi:hypothetical protein